MSAFSSWGNPAVDPSDQAWDGSLAPALGHQDSPSGPCGMAGDQTVGRTWGASGPTLGRGPVGTVPVPMIGSETDRNM